MTLLSFASRALALTLRSALPAFLLAAAAPLAANQVAAFAVENPPPGAAVSGVGVISGWACSSREIEVSFNGSPVRVRVPTGGSRADTAAVCGRADTGFGLLFNFNLLGAGTHSVQLYTDGVPAGPPVGFQVNTLGSEFLAGALGSFDLPNFPAPGRTARIEWRESVQNFVIAGVTAGPSTAGALDRYPFDFGAIRMVAMGFADSTSACRVSLRYTNRNDLRAVIPALVFDVIEGSTITGTATFGRRVVKPGETVEEVQSIYTTSFLRCATFGLRFNSVQSQAVLQ